MSTHNICFCGETRKIFIWIPLLSGAMYREAERCDLWFSQIMPHSYFLVKLLFSYFSQSA